MDSFAAAEAAEVERVGADGMGLAAAAGAGSAAGAACLPLGCLTHPPPVAPHLIKTPVPPCFAAPAPLQVWGVTLEQEWELTAQLRDEIELEAGPLAPEHGGWVGAHQRVTSSHACIMQRLPEAFGGHCSCPHCSCPLRACLVALSAAPPGPPPLPLPPLQTRRLCAASCEPASTTFSRPRSCSW